MDDGRRTTDDDDDDEEAVRDQACLEHECEPSLRVPRGDAREQHARGALERAERVQHEVDVTPHDERAAERCECARAVAQPAPLDAPHEAARVRRELESRLALPVAAAPREPDTRATLRAEREHERADEAAARRAAARDRAHAREAERRALARGACASATRVRLWQHRAHR